MKDKPYKISIDKDNVDILLEGEYALINEERLRRSQEQTEYLKFVLIGIVTQVGLFIFNFINTEENPLLKTLDPKSIEQGLLLISCGIVILTTILFFFWLDHALTISAIDKYYKEKECKNNVTGWYQFREKYSKETYFKIGNIQFNLMNIKIQLFKTAVIFSFLTSPTIFLLIASFSTVFKEYSEFLYVLNFGLFLIFLAFIIFGLMVWQYSGKTLYFHKKEK